MQTSATKIEEVSFKNIKGTSAKRIAMRFACSDEFPCEKILLKNIQLSLSSGEKASSFIWKANLSCSGSVDPPVCSRVLKYLRFPFEETLSVVSIWIGSALSRMIGDFLL